MGKSATMSAVMAVVSFGVGATVSSAYSTAGTAVVQETVKNGFQEIALSFTGQLFSSLMPSLDVPIGDWNVSLSPVILTGKGLGMGAAVGISYNSGDFTFSYGFGITAFAKHYATGNSGTEIRNSFMVNYDDGKTGFSLGTNFWSGGVTDGNSQQTGVLKFRSGDFRFQYENDGTPFQKIGAGDGGDSYRTAAASIGIGEFSAGFNLFTGHRPTSSYAERGGEDLQEMQRAQSLGKNSRGNYNVWMPNGFVQEDKPQYRMGALYFSYKNYGSIS